MKQPLNPYLVLAVAVVLPGMGQVLNRQPVRGLVFVCFAILLGGFTLKTASRSVKMPTTTFLSTTTTALMPRSAILRQTVRTIEVELATINGSPFIIFLTGISSINAPLAP